LLFVLPRECELNPGGLTPRVSHSHISLSAKNKGDRGKKFMMAMIEAHSVNEKDCIAGDRFGFNQKIQQPGWISQALGNFCWSLVQF